jgi:hypothetical protein
MSLELLKKVNATLDNEEAFDASDLPLDIEGAPPLQAWDDEYTHCVLYDPNKFTSQQDIDDLVERVRCQFPEHLRWVADPVSAGSLHGRMHIYSAYHTKVFLEQGYIAEIEAPLFTGGRQSRSIRSKQAWDAFLCNAWIAEAIIYSCRKLPAERRHNLIFRDAYSDAFTPTCGLAQENDETPGTDVLCDLNGLLVAPRSFRQRRMAVPADPVTPGTAVTLGRAIFESMHAMTRKEFTKRLDLEVEAWSDMLADRFSIDGLILWSMQNLALLRVQATEWKYREKPDYAKSGTRLFAGKPKVQASKKLYTVEHLDHIADGLRNERYFVPTMSRPVASVLGDVRSILAGGIGLEDEAIWRDEMTLRDAYSPDLLAAVADWVSELKRMHRATLTGPMARLIQEILTDELQDLDELRDSVGQSALRLVRRQFPDAIWRGLLDCAINAPDHINELQIRYRLNDNPTDPIALERDGDTVVIVGPVLDLNAHNHTIWARRAEMFRERGTLTI